jgi:predicted DNA-binding transcriptional regulator YafY
MGRSTRLFELIQILRAADRPVSAVRLAETLEVSVRTIYRDIAALQAMWTPVEGAAGVGYILRASYDLPPVNFDAEEVEALGVGLSMLARTGDSALQRAALRVRQKTTDLMTQFIGCRLRLGGARPMIPHRGVCHLQRCATPFVKSVSCI